MADGDIAAAAGTGAGTGTATGATATGAAATVAGGKVMWICTIAVVAFCLRKGSLGWHEIYHQCRDYQSCADDKSQVPGKLKFLRFT